MKIPNFLSEPQFLAVTINSGGGDVVQAKNIARLLKNYSLEKRYFFEFFKLFRIPYYTFAEDLCLNSANIILTSGTKSFASKKINKF